MSEYKPYIIDELAHVTTHNSWDAQCLKKTLDSVIDVKQKGPNEELYTSIRSHEPDEYGMIAYEVVLSVIQFFPPDYLLSMLENREE
jgi:hypothetical protein